MKRTETKSLYQMQELLREIGPEAATNFREELRSEWAQAAQWRLDVLLGVLQYTSAYRPNFLTPAEHFAIHYERVAWLRVQEDLLVIDPMLIELNYEVSAAIEKKVRQIDDWINLKNSHKN